MWIPVKTVRRCWSIWPARKYDALILDIMMPVLDGLSVLKSIRRRGCAVPVLLLTAKDSIEDRVAGLDAGANDYLVKPFAFEELLARIRVLLRKPAEAPSNCLQTANLKLLLDTHQVFRGDTEIPSLRKGILPASLPDAK